MSYFKPGAVSLFKPVAVEFLLFLLSLAICLSIRKPSDFEEVVGVSEDELI